MKCEMRRNILTPLNPIHVCMSFISEAFGDDVTNCMQNSLFSISWGSLALDRYTTMCLFHCFEIFAEASSGLQSRLGLKDG